jgi:hypothetical protein
MITVLERTKFAVFFEREEVAPVSLAWNLYHFGFERSEDAQKCYDALLVATNHGSHFRNLKLCYKVRGIWMDVE